MNHVQTTSAAYGNAQDWTMSAFALLMQRCGLSQREVAEFLEVRLDTIKSWSSGRNPTRLAIINEMRDLCHKIEESGQRLAEGQSRLIEKQREDSGQSVLLEFGVAQSDAEARTLGFPCIGAHAAALGVAIANLPSDVEVDVVPRRRGETPTAIVDWLKSVPPAPFAEIPPTTSPAFYFDPSEVLARIEMGGIDQIEYRFNELRAFYLRLIPTKPRSRALKVTELLEVVVHRKLDVLTRTLNAGAPDRNRFGAIAFEPHGTSTTPLSFSQTFPNGEIWGVTSNLIVRRKDKFIVPTTNVENLYRRALENYCRVASHEFAIEPPYQVELGAIGLRDAYLGIGMDTAGPIYENERKLRRLLNDTSRDSVHRLVEEFLSELFDLAGEVR